MNCSDRESTIIYFHNGYNIVVLGTSQCLDRERCDSSYSNFRYSVCDHCGAKNWDIKSDGSLRDGKNCIFSISSGDQAEVRHCSYHGFERFNVLVLGDHFLLKSVKHGDCVGGGKFVDCDCAPSFYVIGIPRNYSIRLYVPWDNNGKINVCLVRKSCNSSTSNLKFDKCDHCGAKHWSIEGDAVGEDEMKNCINRGSKSTT